MIDRFKRERIRDSTKTNYYVVWKLFNEFFIKLDNKPDTWEDRLILFVGHLIQQNKKSQTVRSYVSAIRAVLRDDGIVLNEDKFLLNAITRACRLKNDKVKTRLPIKKPMLHIVLKKTREFFNEKGQLFLASLYCSLFSTAYYGLFRIGEITLSPHVIKVTDVNIGGNKNKLLFVLRSSKTHGRFKRPQTVKISSSADTEDLQNNPSCPYGLLKDYLSYRPRYNSIDEQFFVFGDRIACNTLSHMQGMYSKRIYFKLAGFELEILFVPWISRRQSK